MQGNNLKAGALILLTSIAVHPMQNPFKGISIGSVRQTIYEWARPVPEIIKLATKYPLWASIITISGGFIYKKDRWAALIYAALLYIIFKYNYDQDARYRSANEYMLHERQSWNQIREGNAQMDALDRAVFNQESPHDELHEYHATVLEMAYLPEAGGNAPIYEPSNCKEPCFKCTKKLILPFDCISCDAQYCVGCVGHIKNNQYKCLGCNYFMQNIFLL